MSDDEDSGLNIGGAAVGLGAGVGGTLWADRILARRGVEQVWKGDAKAPADMKTQVQNALTSNQELQNQANGINAFNKITDPTAKPEAPKVETKAPEPPKPNSKPKKGSRSKPKPQPQPPAAPPPKAPVEEMKFSKGKTGTDLHIEGKENITIKNLNLPDSTHGTTVSASDKIVGEFNNVKPAVQKAEQNLTTELRAASKMDKLGSGILKTTTNNKLLAGTAIVATIGAGYYIGKRMFPSHSDKIARERAVNQDLARA